ncbi:MAG: (d)CMP kinase [Bdellovibrionota bacterium]|nr:(d)CMP kinase [Bdellovibrionota bacterium]
MNHTTVIAIDGPSGSGKSTIAKSLAERLGTLYIDTGAMFRALAYSADQSGVNIKEESSVNEFLNKIKLEYQTSDGALIKVDGIDLSEKIREHHVSKLASMISGIPSVRSYLLDFQRTLAKDHTCVMEGRDIGTVVFPNAFIKFFVTASIEVRAKRRLDQLNENGENSVELEQVIKDVKKRDEKDTSREVAPLKMADDATLVDTSNMDIEDVLSKLANDVNERASKLNIVLGNNS